MHQLREGLDDLHRSSGPSSWAEAKAFYARDRPRNGEVISLVTLALFRLGQWLERDRRAHLMPLRRLWRVVYDVWCGAVVGIELPASLDAGPGLRLRHAARGAVVHPQCRLGSNVTIFHGVTLGTRGPGQTAAPTIGHEVMLLTRCLVLGGVDVGDGAVVGGHAVVIDDVPAGGRVVPPRSRLL